MTEADVFDFICKFYFIFNFFTYLNFSWRWWI